jgi:hypothetical protein
MGFSSEWQREWSRIDTGESMERTTVVHSEEGETQNQCARRGRSEIRGWRCGFMLRTGGASAEIWEGVGWRRGIRQPAWFRRKADIATASEGAARARWLCYWLIGWLEQLETEWKKLRSPSVSEKSEVADAHKAARQQV